MNKTLVSVFAFVVALLTGCAMPPQQANAQQYVSPVSAGNTANSNCSIEGRPNLQNMKGLSEANCAEIARIAGTSAKVAGNNKLATTYGDASMATKFNGRTCAVLSRDNKILADFLDASKNPKGVVVTSGAECLRARQQFEQGA